MNFLITTPVIMLVVLVLPSQGSNPCVPALKPLNEGIRGTRPMLLSGHIIIPAYNFTCYGAISRWEAKVTGRGRIHFQVWRWVPEARIHRLVGENTAVVGGIRGDIVRLLVTNPLEQILVTPGDFIGLFIVNEGKIQSTVSSDIVSYISDFPGPLEGFAKPLLIDPAFKRRLQTAPLIGATVEVVTPTTHVSTSVHIKSTSSTDIPKPTQTPDTSGNTGAQDPLPYTLITGVSISGAFLVAICIGIFVTIACFIIKNKKLKRTQNVPTDATDGPSKMSTLLNSLNTPRRNLLLAFRRQGSVQGTLREETRNARPVVGVNMNTRNPNISQSTLELSYAYPTTERPIHLVRSTSATLPRKTGSHANIPLPEIPKEIELRENPSYSALNSQDSLDQPDTRGVVADSTVENVYDVPVFNQRPSIPIEYEIPVSSLNSSGGLTIECSHMYESTDDMYSEIFD